MTCFIIQGNRISFSHQGIKLHKDLPFNDERRASKRVKPETSQCYYCSWVARDNVRRVLSNITKVPRVSAFAKENSREVIESSRAEPHAFASCQSRNVAFSLLVSFHRQQRICVPYTCEMHRYGIACVSRTQAATHLRTVHRCASSY